MELSDYLRILRMRWLGVLLITVLVVGAGAAYTFTRPKVYASDASGFVTVGSGGSALASVNDELAKSRAKSYEDLATSRATAQEVIDDLGLDTTPAALVGQISVTQPEDTVSIKITAKASSPRAAQELANAWVAALATQVQKIEDPLGKDRPNTPKITPVEGAEVPSTPVSPNPPRNLALALVLGLLLGFGYAMLRHTLDRRLRTPEAVQRLFSVPVVGAVPQSKSLARGADGRVPLVALEDARRGGSANGAAEAFRKLRTNLVYMRVDDPVKVIVVTSPKPSDGKSTVAANLAAAMALSGQPVTLVDGDLRRPMVAASLGVDDQVGVTDVLVGRVAARDALQTWPGEPNLRILASGKIPPNPSELLASKAMRQLLAELSAESTVIVDAPPLLPVTDGALLTASADGALVVITTGQTLDVELDTALGNLTTVNGEALGVIMNRGSRRSMGGDYYYYYGGGDYYYGGAPKGRARRKERRATKKQGKAALKQAAAEQKAAEEAARAAEKAAAKAASGSRRRRG